MVPFDDSQFASVVYDDPGKMVTSSTEGGETGISCNDGVISNFSEKRLALTSSSAAEDDKVSDTMLVDLIACGEKLAKFGTGCVIGFAWMMARAK